MKRHPMQCNQAGSVLLEALISILIFSIGILAMVGMQATAINNVSDAKYRADAGFLADQIIGTMWAMRVASTVAGVTSYGPDPGFACNPCNASTGNAATKLWVGASGVSAALPNPIASIAVSGAQVTVTLGWRPPQAAGATHQHVAVAFIN